MALGAGSAAVAGHDWGGALAWLLAMQHPERIERLVILNAPHPIRFLKGLRSPRQLQRSWYMVAFQLPWLPERLVAAQDFEALRRALRRQPTRPGAFTDQDIDRYVAAAAQPGAMGAAINYYRAALRSNPLAQVQTLRRVDVPTLIIWGAGPLPGPGAGQAGPRLGPGRAGRADHRGQPLGAGRRPRAGQPADGRLPPAHPRLRACASRRHGRRRGRPCQRYWVQARRTSRPQMMAALTNASQNSTTSRRRSVHQRSLPYWLPQAWCARSPTGDPPGSVPGSPEWRSRPPSRVRPGPAGTAGRRSRHPSAPPAARAAARPRRWRPGSRPRAHRRAGWPGPPRWPAARPPASAATERFSPCLRRSTGLGPATWPPQGALVVHPSTARCSNSRPNSRHRRPAPPGAAARRPQH